MKKRRAVLPTLPWNNQLFLLRMEGRHQDLRMHHRSYRMNQKLLSFPIVMVRERSCAWTFLRHWGRRIRWPKGAGEDWRIWSCSLRGVLCFRGSVRLVITQCRFSLLFRLLVHMIPGCEYAVHDILDTNDDVTNENKVIQILSVNLQRSDVNLLWQFCSVCTQSELNVRVFGFLHLHQVGPPATKYCQCSFGKRAPFISSTEKSVARQ